MVEHQREWEERLKLGDFSDDGIGKSSAKNGSRIPYTLFLRVRARQVSTRGHLGNPTRCAADTHLCIKQLNSAKSRSTESRITYLRKAIPSSFQICRLNEFVQDITTILVLAPISETFAMKDAS